MSQEDIEIIRRAYADLNRRDVEAWLDAFHPNAEMYDLAGGPEAPARQGHDALREWVETMDEIWEDGRHEPEEFIDAVSDALLLAGQCPAWGSLGLVRGGRLVAEDAGVGIGWGGDERDFEQVDLSELLHPVGAGLLVSVAR